ncbi:MAG: hypothetical protein H7282_08150 [Cytophagaceae bacterium]|nr:hypothetical protein [Cytophagaceae bacterium]
MIKFLFILIIGYVVMKYVLRPILMAFVVKSAGKMMQDMQKRHQSGPVNQGKPVDPVPPKKPNKEVPGEYIDYEEVK